MQAGYINVDYRSTDYKYRSLLICYGLSIRGVQRKSRRLWVRRDAEFLILDNPGHV
jgi:hypothetical protein